MYSLSVLDSRGRIGTQRQVRDRHCLCGGLLERTQYDEVPPRVEYELTDDGRELRERCEPLFEWAVERRRD
ncbi:hypothetical protein BRD01_00975 [Halobacteriales archaeon QS_8_65_32]|nr:MAG: hypothetical protein BRD01_00975 [Halobacteriales archaeon QS_8_65_32]